MGALPDCPLRVQVQSWIEDERQYRCLGGVNFAALGPDAALCHHCRLAASGLDELLHCPQSDVYTFLRPPSPGVVDYDVDCYARCGDEQCGQCPDLKTDKAGSHLYRSNQEQKRE